MPLAPQLDAPTLDARMDALANEHRREIVVRLSESSMSTPELGRRFDFSKQALNRHLTKLERAGLIQRRRQGRVDELKLVPDALDGVTAWVTEIQRGWEASFDRLGNLLASQAPPAVSPAAPTSRTPPAAPTSDHQPQETR